MTTADAAPMPGVHGSSAVRDLYAEQYEPLARFAYRLTSDATVAEDVVHEAFARLMSRWLGVRKPVPFLFRTVANLANDHWRAAQRADALHRALPRPADAAAFDPTLYDAVRRLPRAERDAVHLYYFADLPVGDVAALLGKPPGTVKWLLAAARDRLATDLGGPDA
jgi:RNA polymerase sigma-70 factor (ECF subfamily)